MLKALSESEPSRQSSSGNANLAPKFFQSAPNAPDVMESLLGFAKGMYLDNPIPSLFKERLVVYLSRFCEGRYCITRHCGYLIGLGCPAGDSSAPVATIEQVMRLLKTPTPWERNDMQALLQHLDTISTPIDWPEPETPMEDCLFAAATVVFVQPRRSNLERAALRNALGGERFERLMGLLTFVRATHYWTMVHPELDIDDDVRRLLDQQAELAKLLLEDAEAGRSEMGMKLFDELKALRDLNERRELERAKQALEERERQRELLLRTAEAELAHVSRVTTMGELTASIAHEVLQPISAIKSTIRSGLVWLANEPANLEEVRACLDRIARDTERATEVIERVRALAKGAPPSKTWLDLSCTIHDALTLIDEEASQHQIAIRMALSSELPLLYGDRVQLQQVVLNLALNAIDAMKSTADRPRQLIVTSVPCESGEVLVSVQDSGTGLTQETFEHLFEPFHTTKCHGLGIGLRISRTIIEAHGGRLWAERNPGSGATFHFILPIGEPEDPAV